MAGGGAVKLQKALKSFALIAVALYLTTIIIPGFNIASGLINLLITTAALTLLNLFVRPLIKILLLPVNIITLGAFRWLTSIILLYLLTFIIPEVTIQGFLLNNIPILGGLLPAIHVGRFIATVLTSFSISLAHSLLTWFIK